jgi:hypothetical protein
MNNSGESGPIGAVFLLLVFIVNWFIWLGSFLATVGADIVTSTNLTGIEAFAFYNLNFIVLICMVLGVMGVSYFGFKQ